jgi:PAS domain S-box-containing protein
MAKNYDEMSREELLAEITRLREQCDQLPNLEGELETLRQELSAQQMNLREAQELLEASRDAYAELYDFAPTAYMMLDPNGVIQSINLTGCALLERERTRVLGLPFYGFVAKESRHAFLEHMRRCRRGQSHIESEILLQLPNGRLMPVLIQSRPDTVPPKSFRTVALDLTERKRVEQAIHDMNHTLEQRVHERTLELERANNDLMHQVSQRVLAEADLQEADKRKDQFLAMLGHELRNPLAPIKNAADLLRLVGETVPDLREIYETIERQANHMTRIIDDLLDVSRISRGKIQLRRETIDWRTVIRDVVHDIESGASNSVAVRLDLPNEAVWVSGDSTRLTQAIGNLLHNALKFTDPGGEVLLRLHVDDAANRGLLSVRDTGIGIDPRMLDSIFDIFTQVDRGLDRSRGGLGLGLSLVRALISLHGGEVKAHSAGVGQGTEMHVWLPLAEPPHWNAMPPPKIQSQPRHRILVIDDRRDSLRMLQALLSSMGQEVHVAQSGEEGLEVANAILPEIVFADIGLPGIDGYDVARQLRCHPHLHDVFLVAVTGYGQPEDAQRAYDAGFNRHVPKPVALDTLRSLLVSLERKFMLNN